MTWKFEKILCHEDFQVEYKMFHSVLAYVLLKLTLIGLKEWLTFNLMKGTRVVRRV
jgi:hypothetical protein